MFVESQEVVKLKCGKFGKDLIVEISFLFDRYIVFFVFFFLCVFVFEFEIENFEGIF